MLVDHLGYRYHFVKENENKSTWRCIERKTVECCKAYAIVQEDEIILHTEHKHKHIKIVFICRNILLNILVKDYLCIYTTWVAKGRGGKRPGGKRPGWQKAGWQKAGGKRPGGKGPGGKRPGGKNPPIVNLTLNRAHYQTVSQVKRLVLIVALRIVS